MYKIYLYPKSVIRKTPSICKHTPLFLCVVDNRNFLIARKYSVFKQKKIVDFSNDRFGFIVRLTHNYFAIR